MPERSSSADASAFPHGLDRRVDWPGWACGALLAAGAIAAYGRTLSVPLLFDDIVTIAQNPTLRHWSTAWSPPDATTASGRPVLNCSLTVNYAIGGLAVGSYHAVNLAIHILAGLTLFGIVRRTLAHRAERPATWIAFSAAFLWTLHPLQTESVTYIVQRAESFMGLFYLLTLYCFIRHASGTDPETPRRFGALPWAWLSVLSCLLGMGTKEVMVSAPLIVLLYDRTFMAGDFQAAFRRRGRYYAGLGATWLILPLLVLSTHGRNGTSGFGSGVSWWRYAPTQFPAILRYLRLSAWPHPLVFDYGTQWVSSARTVAPAAAVVIGLIGATGWALFRPAKGGFGGPELGFAGAFFFAILAPTSLMPGNRQTAAEHRMYLALIPVMVPAVIGIYRKLGCAALPFCLVAAAALGGITWRRNQDYASALALWSDTVAKCPANAFAHRNLGDQLRDLPGRLPDAIAQYQEALRLKPDYGGAHNNLAAALARTPGRLPEALAHYQAALRLNPRDPEAHNNLAVALARIPGRLPAALAHYRRALSLAPDFAEAHFNLATVLAGNPASLPEAIAHYRDALRLNPDYAEAHNNLGEALARTPARLPEAIPHYEAALRLKPDFPAAHNNLAVALAGIPGRRPEAIAHFREALRLAPDFAEAHNNFANALARNPAGLPEAIAHYREAVRLAPDFAEAHNNLAVALAGIPGRRPEAIAHFREALRLNPNYTDPRDNLEKLQGRVRTADLGTVDADRRKKK